jgi:riboflavin synthase
MFTGIVEESGVVRDLESRGGGARMLVECALVLQDAFEGASIAVNGVCLTAVGITSDSFAADLAPETLRRTNLGRLRPGSTVNLERPLQPTGRLSGHIVQGHVDGTGEVLALESLGNGDWWLRVRIPQELDRYVVFKGSIAIDGISLTVAAVDDRIVSITIIPHTYAATSIGSYRNGDLVNIECDIFAKYLEKMIRVSGLDLRGAISGGSV